MFLRQKSSKSIKSWLFKDYIIIMLIGMVCSIVAEAIVYYSIDRVFANRLELANLYAYPYENMDISPVKALGGWVEILDEDKKVVRVLGKKRDKRTVYSEESLFNSAVLAEEQNRPFLYSTYVIKERRDEGAYCLAIVPRNIAKQVIAPNYFLGINGFVFFVVLVYLIIFLAFFYFGSRFYSYLSAGRIQQLLREIRASMGEIRKRNYTIRLRYNAEDEFMEIRDSFNHMADKLQHMEEEKQRLFADITHDLNTPITSIVGYAKALYDGKIKEEEIQKEYLKTIYQKSIRVSQLVKDLFEFSKLNEYNQMFKRKKIDFTEWLRQLIGSVYFEIVENGFELEVDIPDEPVYVDFDEKQMMRAVINLVDNAMKYNSPGIKLAVKCFRHESNLVIKVCDNGAGISKELAAKIFEPFVRGENARSSKGGTGLGLSIVEKIAEMHGGSIELTSDGDYKTVFMITLPCLVS
jgi:signal transduction histidine kinase